MKGSRQQKTKAEPRGKGIASIQKLVSKKKRRFVDKENGFNLDLSYINDRIIAMGYPSIGKEATFRNPRSEVQRFLSFRHGERFKVYNLCSERSYEPEVFDGRVARFPFEDHNCPPLQMLFQCCADIEEWLGQHEENVAAIHCKAGKGRTGLVISCWLIWNGDWPDAESALSFYAAARTFNQKGVTIPSQLRYVRYFAKLLRESREPPPPRTRLLSEIVLQHSSSPGDVKFVVQAHGKGMVPSTIASWRAKGVGRAEDEGSGKRFKFVVQPALPVSGDIKIICNGKPLSFHFWFNTALHEGPFIVFEKPVIDKAAKDKGCKVFPEEFAVLLRFSDDEVVAAAEEYRSNAMLRASSKRSMTAADDSRKTSGWEYKYPASLLNC